MEKIKIPTPEERRIADLEKENKQLAETLDMVLTDLIPSLVGGEI